MTTINEIKKQLKHTSTELRKLERRLAALTRRGNTLLAEWKALRKRITK